MYKHRYYTARGGVTLFAKPVPFTAWWRLTSFIHGEGLLDSGWRNCIFWMLEVDWTALRCPPPPPTTTSPPGTHLCLSRRKNSTNKTHQCWSNFLSNAASYAHCFVWRLPALSACLSDGRIKILRLRWRWSNWSVTLTGEIWSAWRKTCPITTVFSRRKLTWIFLNYS
jgi:hypothetical protein